MFRGKEFGGKVVSMMSSLIPEKPIQVSPSLAATIGLEEATMLSILDELASHRETRQRDGLHWLLLEESCLARHMSFWTDHDIQRISKSLKDKGILRLASAPFCDSRVLHFAFDENIATREEVNTLHPTVHNTITPGASVMSPNWQPSDETLAQIAQHNIPLTFVREQIAEFVTFWRESGESHRSWGAKFLQHVIHQWQQHQTFLGRRTQETAMQAEWRPSHDAMEVLIKHAGINAQFVEDAIAEFILYWRERGDASRTWNSKFIQHVRRQWARFTSALEHDTEPRLISENWQPNEDVYDVLRLANIDLDFARQLVPEFVLFWRDSKQMYISWNTKFLQHAKFHWARRHALTDAALAQSTFSNHSPGQNHAGQQSPSSPNSASNRTRDRSISEQLADRSWAY